MWALGAIYHQPTMNLLIPEVVGALLFSNEKESLFADLQSICNAILQYHDKILLSTPFFTCQKYLVWPNMAKDGHITR